MATNNYIKIIDPLVLSKLNDKNNSVIFFSNNHEKIDLVWDKIYYLFKITYSSKTDITNEIVKGCYIYKNNDHSKLCKLWECGTVPNHILKDESKWV